MNKNSFVIYDSWAEIIKELPDAKAGEIAKAMCLYVFDDEVPEFSDPVLPAIFAMMKVKLDADDEVYQKKASSMRKNRNHTGKTEITQENEKSDRKETNLDDFSGVSVSVSDTVSVNDKEREERKRSRFSPPTVEEVKTYCQERQNNVDAQQFVDFYSSKGWIIGTAKMKDWKAAVRTWEHRETARSGTTRQSKIQGQDYDLDELERILVKN